MPVDMGDLAYQVLLMVVSLALGAAASGIRNAKRDREENKRELQEAIDAEHSVLQLLLYYRIKDEFHVHIGKGEPMRPAERRDLDRMYHLYHDEYGGNGGGTAMYKRLCELPIED